MTVVVAGHQMHAKFCDKPLEWAILGLHQRAASRYAWSSTLPVTLVIRLSLRVRGAAGHGSSSRISKCGRRTGVCDRPTVRAVARSGRPTISMKRSSWQAGTLRARSVNACEVPLRLFQ